MLTIVAAMEQELAGVRRALESHQHPDVELHVIGVGRNPVERGLRGLLPTLRQQREGAEPPRELLLLGFAGAVDPSLSAGDLALAGRYCRLVSGPALFVMSPESMGQVRGGPPSPELLSRLRGGWSSHVTLRHAIQVIPERPVLKFLETDTAMRQRARESLAEGGLTAVETDSMTVEEVVTKRGTKEELHQRYGVGTVNMEDYWVARRADAAKVPFLSVRAALDTAGQGLPSYLLRLSGRPRGEAARQAAIHPWDAPTLVRLGRQMRLAQASLARFAMAYINDRAAEVDGVPTGD